MSKYICEACNKPKPIDTDALQIGDEVNFTIEQIGMRSTKFISKKGVIGDAYGDICRVDTKARSYTVKRESLTPSDAPSPLTWCFGECECVKEAEAHV